MADIDNVSPLKPLWPVRPPNRSGPKKHPPKRPESPRRKEPGEAGKGDHEQPTRVDEYA